MPLADCFGSIQTWNELTLIDVLLRPPAQQSRKALFGRIDRPIQLRREIIHPAVDQPLARIGIKFRISIKTSNRRRGAGAPDAKRANAKLYPGLGGLAG